MNYSSNDTVELLGRRVEVLEKQLIALRNPWLCPICGHVMTEMESKGYKGCPDCFHAAQHVRPVDLIAELVVLKEQITALELSNRNLIMELAACQQKLSQASQKRMYPIMGGPSVPWEVMTPHASQAEKNHYQTLERLAERGGLVTGEAWCVVSGIHPSMATREQWDKWDAEWREYADRINLHFAKLDECQQKLDAAERALQIMVDDGECYCTDNVASKEPCGWCNAKGLLCRK